MTHNDRVPPLAFGDLAARLAALTLEALERDADGTWSTPPMHEDDILADAARGLARRCARRAALADAATWESAAATPAPQPAVRAHDGSDETAILDHLRALLELAGPTDPLDDATWDRRHAHDQRPGS